MLAAPDGMPVAWCLATPKLGEREVAAACWTTSAAGCGPGMVILADKGLAGRGFEQLVADLARCCCGPTVPMSRTGSGRWVGVRQWIESTFDTLKDQLGLERHGGRTLAGRLGPGRPTAARPGRRDLAELADRRA